jgi:hypothetical protein
MLSVFAGLLFNGYWLFAVYTQSSYWPVLLVIAVAVFVLLPPRYCWRAYAIKASAVLAGLLLDQLWLLVGVFKFTHSDGLPIWMAALWITFISVWFWLAPQLALRLSQIFLLGLVSGPLSYYSGQLLGAIEIISNLGVFSVVLGLAWGSVLLILTVLAKKQGLSGSCAANKQ